MRPCNTVVRFDMAHARGYRQPRRGAPALRSEGVWARSRVDLADRNRWIATMVEGRPNSTLDERHLDCRWLRRRQTRSFWQAV